MSEEPDSEGPSMLLRKSGGWAFFLSPEKTLIYYMSVKHVREMLDGSRDFACIHKDNFRG